MDAQKTIVVGIDGGTPVIATRRGSVSEVVDAGVTGAIIDDGADIREALASTDRLDPETVRGRVQERFSVNGWLRITCRCTGRCFERPFRFEAAGGCWHEPGHAHGGGRHRRHRCGRGRAVHGARAGVPAEGWKR